MIEDARRDLIAATEEYASKRHDYAYARAERDDVKAKLDRLEAGFTRQGLEGKNAAERDADLFHKTEHTRDQLGRVEHRYQDAQADLDVAHERLKTARDLLHSLLEVSA